MESPYKSNIWKIYLFGFVSSLHFIGGVLVPFFTIWGGLTLTQVMILQSWFFIWIFLLEVPTGTIADYFGRKWSLVLAKIFVVLAVIVYTTYPIFYIFLLGEFLWAVAGSLLSGALDAFTYDTLKEIKIEKESKEVLAKLRTYGLGGIMIAAPIGSVMAAFLGLKAPMLLMAIPAFIAVIIGFTLKEPKITKKVKKDYFNILKEGVIYFKRHRILKILALDFIVIATLGYSIIWMYQPLLLESGLSIGYLGIAHAFLVMSEILVINNYKKLEKLLGSKRRVIFISAFIPSVMFIVAGFTHVIPILLIIIFLAGGFALGREPLFSSYMNKYIPSDKRATVLSTVSMVHTAIIGVFSPLLGILADWSLSKTLIILGIIALIFTLVSRVEENMLLD